MPAPIGNKLWTARTTHGRHLLFESPKILWKACVEYFEWVEANPLWEVKSYMYQGEPVQDQVPKMRAMTIGGLCLFLRIDRSTWQDYGKRDNFIPIVREAEEVIRSQKFSGAAADQLNANIIARELGLADKRELTGEDGGPIKTEDVSITEVARRMAFVLASAAQELDDAADEKGQKDHDRHDS